MPEQQQHVRTNAAPLLAMTITKHKAAEHQLAVATCLCLCVCVLAHMCASCRPADDSVFYDNPRFVYHIDDGAVKALTE